MKMPRFFLVATLLFTACGDDDEVSANDVISEERTLAVPIDEAMELGAGNEATLRYFIYARPSATETLIVHFGGPGSSATESLADFVTGVPDAVLDRYAVVGVDEIGISAGTELGCSPIDETALQGSDTFSMFFADYFAGCARQELLSQTGTQRYARDLERVRQALGASELSFLGYSYGTRVALTYAALFPERTGRLALDAVFNPLVPYEDFILAQLRAGAAAFDSYFAWCETEPTCDVSATDFVELQDAVDASASDLIASGYSTLILFVRNQYAWDIVAPVVAAALDSLAILEDLALDSDVDESVFLSTVCSDTVPAVDRETAIATQAAFESEYAGPFPVRFFGTIAQEVLEACSVWTAPEPALDFAAALSAVSSETLIITAIGDTQTPSALVDSLLDTLDNEQQVLINEVAHTHAFQELNACVDRAVNDFLLGLPVNATQCPRTVLEIAGALSVPSPKYVSNKLRHRFPRF